MRGRRGGPRLRHWRGRRMGRRAPAASERRGSRPWSPVAEEAVRLASADARAARRAAAAALAGAEDVETRSVAERASGLAAVELGDVAGAVAHLEQARELALAGGLAARAGEADMSLSL